MTEPRNMDSNIYRGGGHFEFSSEKHWGVEQDDCKIFDSIDTTHLEDSIASVPFNIRHNLPIELFTDEQLEEFEVESSLALSRHTFQCNSKLKKKSVGRTSIECREEAPKATDKLLNLILNNLPSSEEIHIHPDNEVQSNGPLDAILGNMKPLIDMLQDETNTIYNADTCQANLKITEDQIEKTKIDFDAEKTNLDADHWLDSMLDCDE